ncbi:MAG: MerR family transcriptional regulator [Synergistaceae bacterium]|nr:MerR family transcriptional regulator [Synergistaceae bacterium]
MSYTVGEMAKKLGVAPSTLRYYDKEGLLPSIERSEGGARLFRDSDYGLLKIIECLKATGMQLKDIREFVKLTLEGDGSIEARLRLFQSQKAVVEAQMRRLQETLDIVNYKCWYYETAREHGTTEAPDNMPDAEIPEELRPVRARLKNSV